MKLSLLSHYGVHSCITLESMITTRAADIDMSIVLRIESLNTIYSIGNVPRVEPTLAEAIARLS